MSLQDILVPMLNNDDWDATEMLRIVRDSWQDRHGIPTEGWDMDSEGNMLLYHQAGTAVYDTLRFVSELRRAVPKNSGWLDYFEGVVE
jgi:hypothetical protein